MICTRPTLLTLAWASGRALMSNPVKLFMLKEIRTFLAGTLQLGLSCKLMHLKTIHCFLKVFCLGLLCLDELFCFCYRVSSRATEQPYEKEKALCDKLVNYLEGLHINAIHLPDLQSTSSADKEPAISLAASMLNLKLE